MSLQQRRSLPRSMAFDDGNQLFDLRGISQLECRLERLDEHELGRQEGDAELVESCRQLVLDLLQGRTRVASHSGEQRFVQNERKSVLHVLEFRHVDVPLHVSLGFVEASAPARDLEHIEVFRDDAGYVAAVDLRENGICVVPAAEEHEAADRASLKAPLRDTIPDPAQELHPALSGRQRVGIPIAGLVQDGEVVGRARGGRGKIGLDRGFECRLEEDLGLEKAALCQQDEALARQRLRKDLDQPEAFRQRERALQMRCGRVGLALKNEVSPELGGDVCNILAGSVGGQHLQRSLEPHHPTVDPSFAEVDIAMRAETRARGRPPSARKSPWGSSSRPSASSARPRRHAIRPARGTAAPRS